MDRILNSGPFGIIRKIRWCANNPFTIQETYNIPIQKSKVSNLQGNKMVSKH
jgi:hypothetical protein